MNKRPRVSLLLTPTFAGMGLSAQEKNQLGIYSRNDRFVMWLLFSGNCIVSIDCPPEKSCVKIPYRSAVAYPHCLSKWRMP